MKKNLLIIIVFLALLVAVFSEDDKNKDKSESTPPILPTGTQVEVVVGE